MITAEESVEIKKAVRRLVRAEIAHSWKGTLTDPLDIEIVEDDLKSAKAKLANLLSPNTLKKGMATPPLDKPAAVG